MKILLHLVLIVLLTVVTQIGGVIYLITLIVVKKNASRRRLKKGVVFSVLYLSATFLIVPYVAPLFGRERIKETENITAHNFFYKLANRNYVRPELNKALQHIAKDFDRKNNGIQLVYLDANFPFIDKFPLLPHLSHNDGKKIDVSFVYNEQNGALTNKKPSVSGYGVYENPTTREYDQITVCKRKGYWQYDFPKYLTFGKVNKDIEFSIMGTRQLANSIVKQSEIGKLFIEPHLKTRLKLNSGKVRYHGCQAVRHDDHIHFQLK
ncbi:hypothetical protein HCU67_16090 [Muricauda sp. DJ-13]|uniref:Uncharacterized protein n=1 Tax=Croceivirga thetidis TaxID=2721623 RepID=A0ABX1GWW8_9FLAO|nr:hypothetical protein [Croceivirga thetidis]